MFKTLLPWSDHHARQSRKKKDRRRTRWLLKKAARVVCAVFLLNLLIIGALRWVPVPFSAFMMHERVKGQPIDHRWVAWDRISPHMALAVIAAEDQKFPQHWGFDFGAIAQAVEDNKSRGALRGASTISQQVAKNLFLWPGRSWLRKGLEAFQTLWIELLWPKRRILEVYLNIAEFGPGIFGVGAASGTYIKLPASDLTARHCALLAAVLPNPRKMRVNKPSAYVRERAAHIRRQMVLLGGIDYLAFTDR